MKSEDATKNNDWIVIQPQVHAEAEFFEILNDFGNPLEALREAISNAVDAHASEIKISFDVEELDGAKRLVIVLVDNGDGMTREVLSRDFWGLGFSPSRKRTDAIGEKGHGTKIYLRSQRVVVRTQSTEGAYQSECDYPLSALSRRVLHQPKIKEIARFLPNGTGTEIRIIGYNDNVRSMFVQDIVRDYLLWFTKIGSIEREFDRTDLGQFKTLLKCLDVQEFETVSFGHIFPPNESDIEKLFKQFEADAADWYVKKRTWKSVRLPRHPEVTFDAVISVEGDEAKRKYNPMIRERLRSDSGKYRVSDRYGIWLCKDYIPVVRVNDWITGFGSGSNAFVLLHGFVNCQQLKLTANRGTVANTDPEIIEELQNAVKGLVDEVDAELSNKGIYTLRTWQEEQTTLQQEKDQFNNRLKRLKQRKTAKYKDRLLVEPQTESELFGLFMQVYALNPGSFPFEPLDYNTTKGIDIIARNKSENRIIEGEHWYIELKHLLRANFNHVFQYIRWVICWDFDKGIVKGSELRGVDESDVRYLVTDKDDKGNSVYFLDNRKKATKIQVIRLKEYLDQQLKITFKAE